MSFKHYRLIARKRLVTVVLDPFSVPSFENHARSHFYFSIRRDKKTVNAEI